MSSSSDTSDSPENIANDPFVSVHCKVDYTFDDLGVKGNSLRGTVQVIHAIRCEYYTQEGHSTVKHNIVNSEKVLKETYIHLFRYWRQRSPKHEEVVRPYHG